MTTPAAAPVVQSAEGRDVSNFQGKFDWARAKADGAIFGIYRLTQGLPADHANSPDPTAAWNHGQLKTLGMHRGAYHFLNPAEPGAAQAQYFVTQHKLLGLDQADMLWCDNETPGSSPAVTAKCAADFMNELNILTPHNPRGVYTFIDFAREGYCAGLEHYPLWLSYPNATAPKPPPPWTRWTFWQWGSRDGTDADAFNGTSAQLAAWIASFAPAPATGPYRHVTHLGDTAAHLAKTRNESITALVANSAKHYTPADLAAVEAALVAHRHLPLPSGLPWYTVNP